MSVNSSGGSGSGGSNGGGGSNSGNPCGACKFLRRKCVPGCIFAPYFDAEQGASHFAAVHKVFGASNVSKLLLNIPIHKRLDAVITICYEAQSRQRDPVYGCVAHIFALQQQVLALQAELSYLQGHLATMELPQSPPAHPPQAAVAPPVFSIADLPTAAAATATLSMPATFDASSLFEQSMAQSPWAMQHRAMMDPRQYLIAAPMAPIGGVDLQTVARELMHRHVTAPAAPPLPPPPPPPCSNASSSSQSLSSK